MRRRKATTKKNILRSPLYVSFPPEKLRRSNANCVCPSWKHRPTGISKGCTATRNVVVVRSRSSFYDQSVLHAVSPAGRPRATGALNVWCAYSNLWRDHFLHAGGLPPSYWPLAWMRACRCEGAAVLGDDKLASPYLGAKVICQLPKKVSSGTHGDKATEDRWLGFSPKVRGGHLILAEGVVKVYRRHTSRS